MEIDRVIETEDGEGTTSVAYNADGQLATVTDGLGHTWTYAYDTALRLTSITDPVSKYVKYFYDSAAGSSRSAREARGRLTPPSTNTVPPLFS